MKFLLEIVFAVLIMIFINIAIAIHGYFSNEIYLESAIDVLIIIASLYLGKRYANRVIRKGKSDD